MVIIEALDILENVIMFITPAALCCLVIFFVMRIVNNKKESAGQHFKALFCIVVTVGIIFSVLVAMIYNVYQIGVIWKEYEVGKSVEPHVKQLSFIAVEFVWQMIGVALMFLLWKYVYIHQIIPGTGTAVERLKVLFKKLKEM